MQQKVNYIAHHKKVNLKIIEDKNLSSIHISLYNALFLIWNECGFDTELSINRNDVMKLSKIGSANTYTKALKQLSDSGYLLYKPSYNPLIGSKIKMYRFDKGCDNGSDKGTVKSSSKGCDNGSDTLSKPENNETKKQNKQHSLFSFKKSLIEIGVKEQVASDWLKVRSKKKASNTETAFKQLKTQIEKSGKSANECILICVENSWKGFNAEWIEKESDNKPKYTQPKRKIVS